MAKKVSFKIFSTVLVVIFGLAVIPVKPAKAADTGWNSPTYCISTSTPAWNTPGFAASDDGQYATVAGNNANLVCAFNLPALPAGSYIEGIEVRFQGSSTGTREADNVQFSWDGGATYSPSAPTTAFTAVETIFTLGTTTDTWGRTWATSDFTSDNFRARFQSDANTGTISLDYIEVRVTYSTHDMDISGNGTLIADGDTTPSTTDNTGFGNVGVASSVVHTFTVTNTGNVDLNLSLPATIGGANPSEFVVTALPASIVPPGGSTTFDITFTPIVVGARSATFSLNNDDPNENPYNFSLNGNGSTSPEMDLFAANGVTAIADNAGATIANGTAFGNVGIGMFAESTFVVWNNGFSNLNITSATTSGSADFSLMTALPISVPAGGSTTLTIRYTPTSAGAVTGGIDLNNNDTVNTPENPYDINLSGTGVTGPAPEVDFQYNGTTISDGDGSPSPADGTNLGTSPVGTGITLMYTIRNLGNANLTLSAPTLGGTVPADFSATTPAALVSGGGSTTFQITCTPSAIGDRDATISFTTNDTSGEGTYNFTIRCTGTNAPEISVQGNGAINISDNDTTPSAADGTAFGNAGIGNSVINTFTILNTGTTNLTLASPAMTGSSDFIISTAPVSPVPPGGSTTFAIQYTPSSAALVTATFSVTTNDFSENPFNFDLSGTGVAAAPEIDIQFTGISIADGDNSLSAANGTHFGTVTVGTFAELTYTIKNLGSSNLTLTTPINFTGANPGDYSATTSPTFPIAAGGSATFVIRFTPSIVATRNATFNIVTNDANEATYNFNLRGVGGANNPPIIVSNLGEATANISVAENQTAVTTVSAIDLDAGQSITYSLTGGVDQGDFSIVSGTGVLTFAPAPNFEIPSDADTNNTYIVQVTATDSAGGTDTQTLTVTVTDVNDAPAGTDGATTILEDFTHTFSAANFGFTDSDNPADAFNRVRITTLPAAGTLTLSGNPVSVNDYVDVVNIPNLLFTPAANGNGTPYASFTFQVEDDGGTVNGGLNLDASPNTFTINVSADNDAPILDASRTPVLVDVAENAGAPSGAVGTLISSLVDFTAPAGQVDNVTDIDAGAVLGIAVTAADTANGSWHYSTDNGVNWNPLGAVTGASARMLAADSNTRIYFQPNAGFNGIVSPAITFRAWDQTSAANGGNADTSTNGGATAFSTASDTADITVTAVNDAPVLDTTRNPVLSNVTEDASAPSGAVGSLVSSLVDFAVPAGQVDNVTDPDSSPLLGIAVTAADTANGSWHYSINNGTTWNALGAVTNTAARLLAADANTRIYFQPNANFNGIVSPAITFRAWDQTSSVNGDTADTSVNGGITAFSVATDTANITVDAVNDAPSFTSTNPPAVNEDAGAQTVNPWATGFNPGGGADEAAQTIVSYNVSNLGAGCAALLSAGPLVDTAGILTYTPAANQNGICTFDVVVQDSGSNTPPNINTSAAQNRTITVNSVNDAPTQLIAPNQFRTDGSTVIPQGGTTMETSVVFKSTAIDVDGDQYRLEVEFILDGTAFNNSASCPASSLVASGSEATVTCALIPTGSYKWQYRYVDSLGAPSAWAPFGASDPDFIIDPLHLLVNTNGINSNPDTGDGFISEFEVIPHFLGITQIIVQYNKDVYNPPGDLLQDDVTNPANYLLVYSPAGVFNTLSVASGLVAPDLPVSIDSVTYSNGGGAGPFVATININGGAPLNSVAYYRLFISGTTSIVQANDITRVLAGDGTTAGTDFIRNFQIITAFVEREETRDVRNLRVTNLPATGFAPNRVTILPEQPRELAYADLGDLWIEIPSLGVKSPIAGVPETAEGEWDVTWLANSVGWLNGTAFPTWEGNSVVTAHITNADGLDGPFANLKKLKYGERIIIHLFDEKYIFEVRNSRLSRPYTTGFAFEHLEDQSYLTLITCQVYLPSSDTYFFRRIVRAVLVEIQSE